MKPNRFAPPKRTQADRDSDCQSFCVRATRKAFDATTPDDLLRRYGVAEQTAKYWHAWRAGQAW